MNTGHFGLMLAERINTKGSLCVGIDPHAHLLRQWGLEDTVNGLEYFSMTILEAVGNIVPAVKPQVAFFERFGSAGFAVLETVLQRAEEEFDVLTISDAKRGDIGSTMTGYGQAWVEEGSPLRSSAVTISPYLGFESLAPLIERAFENNRGVFTLALTSNPEAASVQTAQIQGTDISVVQSIIDQSAALNVTALPSDGTVQSFLGSAGLVVGATAAPILHQLGLDLDEVNGPILVPGYGTQGATTEDLAEYFCFKRSKALINSSRGIASVGPHKATISEATQKVTGELAFLN